MKNSLLAFVFLFCLAVGAITVSRHQMFNVDELQASRYLIPPPPMIEHFTFGFPFIIGDFLWLRAIQDFDYCESKKSLKRCREGWLYQMIDKATDLDPGITIAYTLGAANLSVIVDDISGATKLFEKGIIKLPGNWNLAFRASYHYMYELRNFERAAELMWRAARNGAPQWTYSLAARLFTKEGQREMGERVINELERTGAPSDIIDGMRAKMDKAPILDYPDLDREQ